MSLSDEYILNEFVRLEVEALYSKIYREFDQLSLHKLLESQNAYLMATKAMAPHEVLPYMLNRYIEAIKNPIIEQVLETALEYIEIANPQFIAAELLAYWIEQYQNSQYISTKDKLMGKLSMQFSKNFTTINNEIDWKLVVQYVSGSYKLIK